ncbi:MAG: hypothetical protein C0603_11920 [Denitrovibrio sp.]|nr:MAG: hypothetical protein C0603_11920 [Denitrovibrio sp.]
MKMKNLVLSIFLIIFMSVTAFAEQTPADIFNAQVKEAEKTVNQMYPKEVMSWIVDKKSFLLLDVRSKEEVTAGKIENPNYMNLPRGILDVIASKGAIKPDQLIVVYCKKGSRGLLAAKTLQDLGFTNVHNLKGGIHAWMGKGLPITNSLGTFKTVPYDLTGCAEK